MEFVNFLKKKDSIPLILLGVLLLLTAIFWPINWLPFSIHSFKFYTSVAVLFSLLLIQFFYQKEPIRIFPYDFIFLAFLNWVFLSLFWATNTTQVFTNYSAWILMYVFFRLLFQYKPKPLKSSTKFWTSLSLIICGLNYLLILWFAVDLAISKNTSFFHYPNLNALPQYFAYNGNYMAASLVLFTPVFLLPSSFFYCSKKWVNFLFVIHLLVIFSFNSRGSLLALVLMLFLFAFWNWESLKKGSKSQLLIGIGILTSFFIIFSLNQTNQLFVEQLNPLKQINSNQGDDRLALWSLTSKLIQEHPILGLGAGNWVIEYPKYTIEKIGGRQPYTHPHNYYLHVFSDLGIVGFLLFLALIFMALYRFVLNFKSSSEIEKAAFAIIIAFLILSLFYGIQYHTVYWFAIHPFILFSAIVLLLKMGNKNKEKGIEVNKILYLGFLTSLLLSFLICQIYYDVQKSKYKKFIDLKKQKDYSGALEAVKDLYHPIFFSNYRQNVLKTQEAKLLNRQKLGEQAILALKEGISTHPFNVEAWFALGESYFTAKEFDKAQECFKKVQTIDGTYFDANLKLAQISFKKKDWAAFNDNLMFYENQIIPIKEAFFNENELENAPRKIIQYWNKIFKFEDQVLRLRTIAEKNKAYKRYQKKNF